VTDPKQIVERGYDAIAEPFDAWADSFETPAPVWIAKLMERLQPGASVLDLGCGAGRQGAQTIARRHRYTGVDLSQAQLGLARTRIPVRGTGSRTRTLHVGSRAEAPGRGGGLGSGRE
jgi:predicted TPR repeat methyltransferase